MENEQQQPIDVADLTELARVVGQLHELCKLSAATGVREPKSQHRDLLVKTGQLHADVCKLFDGSAVSQEIVDGLTARVQVLRAQLLSAMKTSGASEAQIVH